MRSPAERQVFAVGHYPPPVHGAAVATDRFVALLLRGGQTVRRLNISGDTLVHSAVFYARRLRRTLYASAILIRRARRGDALYLASDNGPGMWLTLLVLCIATARGLARYLHHHSGVYIARRSWLMDVIVMVGGSNSTHIFTCERQARAFQAVYPDAKRWVVLPVTYVLDEQPRVSRSPAHPNGILTLGHLGNLTVEKGLIEVFETLKLARAQGLSVNLKLGGPVFDAADAAQLALELAAAAPHAEYIGAVADDHKAAFFADVNVFLFPSTTAGESFGIVAAEAMLFGVPLIAYETNCLDRAWVGGGGLVLSPNEDFQACAVDLLRRWLADPAAYGIACRSAAERASAERQRGLTAAEQLANAIRTSITHRVTIDRE